MSSAAKGPYTLFWTLLFILLFCCEAFAETGGATINSSTLEYITELKKYVAEGAVKIVKDDTEIEADKVIYYEDTSEVIAEGNVRYKDTKTSAKAARAELNIDNKTGTLYDAEIFQKKENYHLAGRLIEKRGENYYYSDKASFTTCDAPLPAWCFRGKDVNTRVGENITAKDVSFRIKGLPVLYAPYFWASLVTERQTGFLQPTVGHSTMLGNQVNIPFFWAISENSDATFDLDWYSRRGVGTGIEYRFLGISGIRTNWKVYQIYDTEATKEFIEVRGLLEDRHQDRPGGYLSVDYVNESDFYRIYSVRHELTSLRYLESTGEINVPFTNSRLYLLSQYRVDLKNPTGNSPQLLPEIGYVLNYSRVGPFMVSADLAASNFWRNNGLSGERIDLYPKLLFSAGSDVVLSQMLALRETGYAYYRKTPPDTDALRDRSAVEYDANAHITLYKAYSSFVHVLEPTVRYHLIYSSQNNLPVFDSAELFTKTSTIELSLLNRFFIKGTEALLVRVTQGLDTFRKGGDLLPLTLEVGLKTPVPFTMQATYDVDKGRLDTVTSNLAFNMFKTTLVVGQRYNRAEDVMMITAAASINPIKSIQVMSGVWYDVKGQGLQDFNVIVRYLRQCWGIKFEAAKRPGNFSATVKFELAGLGSKASQKGFPTAPYDLFGPERTEL